MHETAADYFGARKCTLETTARSGSAKNFLFRAKPPNGTTSLLSPLVDYEIAQLRSASTPSINYALLTLKFNLYFGLRLLYIAHLRDATTPSINYSLFYFEIH